MHRHESPLMRADDYIEALEADLIAFEKLVSEYESKLRAA